MIMTDEKVNKEETAFFSVTDLAKMLGRSKRTVTRLFEARKLPGLKIGATWFIAKEDWYAFLEREKNR